MSAVKDHMSSNGEDDGWYIDGELSLPLGEFYVSCSYNYTFYVYPTQEAYKLLH